MNAPVSVDILIVSYNTCGLLAECLESIARHMPAANAVSLRIKVFDNCSTDATADMLAERFPHVELASSPRNEGFALANNRLAATSSADYLLLLNPDTVWVVDVITPLLETLQRTPDAVIAGPRLTYPDGELQLSSQRRPSLAYELALPLRGTKLRRIGRIWDADEVIERTREQNLSESRTPRQTEFLWATCWLIARADVTRYGLFDASFPLYDEDLDLCTRVTALGRSIVYRADVDLVHIGGASSNPAAKFALMRAARAHYYRVHRGKAAGLIYRYVVAAAWRLRISGTRRTPVAG
jgi:N-acetylglucosaminyl-diphospho-decaprenol L-rhamnosyltransferase